ncbi:hypothetical protein DEO72_LG1g2990 [Vigna unguiculata]|uniref:Uncharacterized protein n=1 Tax=Vigna unguiculata TaxID=3917 RepID=A0A4D6KXR1_VIGUN|nr:hypothetical protein DEO72_LG1g2990 [Vigna unguiculata]
MQGLLHIGAPDGYQECVDYDRMSMIDNMNCVLHVWGSLEPISKCQKSVALRYSYDTTRDKPKGGRDPKQWQRPLESRGTWRKGWSYQAKLDRQRYCKTLVAWRHVGSARRSGSSGGFYTTLDETML